MSLVRFCKNAAPTKETRLAGGGLKVGREKIVACVPNVEAKAVTVVLVP